MEQVSQGELDFLHQGHNPASPDAGAYTTVHLYREGKELVATGHLTWHPGHDYPGEKLERSITNEQWVYLRDRWYGTGPMREAAPYPPQNYPIGVAIEDLKAGELIEVGPDGQVRRSGTQSAPASELGPEDHLVNAFDAVHRAVDAGAAFLQAWNRAAESFKKSLEKPHE